MAIMGGAETICQGIRAGLVDELSIHLVPVLFGAGTRLFEQVERHVRLEILQTTQLRFRVLPRER
ncbi:dihydrofolate reductase family protein [Nonomuraea sp. NPDC003214]